MNTLLAIESSSDACTIALSLNDNIIIREAFGQCSHSQYLLPFIESMLSESDMTLQQLDGIAFSAGPGSFTGIRLAASVVKTLAYAIQKPVIPISSLQVYAQTSFRLNPGLDQVTVMTDARMGDIYLGEYAKDSNGLSVAQKDDTMIKLTELKVYDFQSIAMVAGDAKEVLLNSEAFSNNQLPAITFFEQSPHALDLLTLSQQYFEEFAYTDAVSAEPIYLRGKSSWKTLEQQKKNNA